MTTLDDVRTALAPLLDDVRRTTGIDLVVNPSPVVEDELRWLIHERDAPPSEPPRRRGEAPLTDHVFFGVCTHCDLADEIISMAREVQELVQMMLWARGEDPTWPPCPVDPTHYLEVSSCQRWQARTQRMIRTPTWHCDRHGIPLGELPPA